MKKMMAMSMYLTVYCRARRNDRSVSTDRQRAQESRRADLGLDRSAGPADVGEEVRQ